MATAVLTALEASTSALQATAHMKGWSGTVERDFQRAVESASEARSAGLRLAHWPAVGAADLMFPGGVAVELKWCKSGDTLANCAWDVAKLACALTEGQIEQGLIAAGAPAVHWDGDAAGVELFASRNYEVLELVRRYESWWRFWCKDVLTRPVDLPTAIAIADAGSIATELDGTPFTLRLARVEVTDGSWLPHICPHRWRGEDCRPRPWDPVPFAESGP